MEADHHLVRRRIYRLATPLDVLRFRPLSLVDRFRFGMLVFQSRLVRDWRNQRA